jgi:hypothetical protein
LNLLVLRTVHFTDGTNWGIFWFLPAMMYFIAFSIFYFLLGVAGIFCIFQKRFHPNLNHRSISLVAISYAVEFLLLTIVYIQSMVMFVGNYTNIARFESVRSAARVVLLLHLIFKLVNVFLSMRYSDQMLEA